MAESPPFVIGSHRNCVLEAPGAAGDCCDVTAA